MGNTLPTQGFVEVTIKRLESMMLDGVINLVSRGLVDYYAESEITYDVYNGTFDKKGEALKLDDVVYDPKDPSQALMVVGGFEFASRVLKDELLIGNDYDIVLPREKKPRKFGLVAVSGDYYEFACHDPSVPDVTGTYNALPPVYVENQGRTKPTGVVMRMNDGSRTVLGYDAVATKKFRMDFSKTHVIVASG